MKCPKCPYYEQKTSYGAELIKCNNKCRKRGIIIAESREVAQALNEFADNLKQAEPQEKEDKE